MTRKQFLEGMFVVCLVGISLVVGGIVYATDSKYREHENAVDNACNELVISHPFMETPETKWCVGHDEEEEIKLHNDAEKVEVEETEKNNALIDAEMDNDKQPKH